MCDLLTTASAFTVYPTLHSRFRAPLGFVHIKGRLCDKCSRSPCSQKHNIDLQRIYSRPASSPARSTPPLGQNGAACKSQLSPWRRPAAPGLQEKPPFSSDRALSRLSDDRTRPRSLGEYVCHGLLFTDAGFSVSPRRQHLPTPIPEPAR